MPKQSSIIDHLKGQPLRVSAVGNPRKGSSIDYYRFGKKDVEKALEQAVEELEEELVEEVTNVPEREREVVTVVDGEPNEEALLRPLIDELKDTLMQGFEQAIARTEENQIESVNFNEQLLNEIKQLPKELPTPYVEVNAPEQKQHAPVRRVRAVNIERDDNGNISGAEFEVER